MKIFFLSIWFLLPQIIFGQAELLNTLLRKYAYTWNENSPLALQASKEFLIPSISNVDTLSVIKWGDIDSIVISEMRPGSFHVVLHGKVVKYLELGQMASCNSKYFGKSYCPIITTDRERLILVAKPKEGDSTNKMREDMRYLLHQLNNSPVIVKLLPPVAVFNRGAKEIVINKSNNAGDAATLGVIDLQQAEKVKFSSVADSGEAVSYNILSFTLATINNDGNYEEMRNLGPIFNEHIVTALKKIRPGSQVLFFDIKVSTVNGFGKLPMFGLKAQ